MEFPINVARSRYHGVQTSKFKLVMLQPPASFPPRFGKDEIEARSQLLRIRSRILLQRIGPFTKQQPIFWYESDEQQKHSYQTTPLSHDLGFFELCDKYDLHH